MSTGSREAKSGSGSVAATITGAEPASDADELGARATGEGTRLAKLKDLFDNGYDRWQYLENLRCADAAGKEVTVSVHPNWELVYSGTDNCAEVSSLVPREVLFHDLHLTVEVTFALQVCGCDFPSYETSELSEIAEFRTRRDQEAGSRGVPLKPGTPRSTGAGARARAGAGSESPLGTPPPVKKEKVVFSCLVRGNMVDFEVDGHTVSGLGQGDYYT